jgi:hypothetical protein
MIFDAVFAKAPADDQHVSTSSCKRFACASELNNRAARKVSNLSPME